MIKGGWWPVHGQAQPSGQATAEPSNQGLLEMTVYLLLTLRGGVAVRAITGAQERTGCAMPRVTRAALAVAPWQRCYVHPVWWLEGLSMQMFRGSRWEQQLSIATASS